MLSFACRGYVYARNPDIGPGKVAYGDNQILYRPLSYDQEGETQNFFQILEKHTLQVSKCHIQYLLKLLYFHYKNLCVWLLVILQCLPECPFNISGKDIFALPFVLNENILF